MNHPPKQLVLLLSLIGSGASCYAHASIDEHPADALQALPGVSCDEAQTAAALPTTDAPRNLIWQPQRSAVDLSGSAGVLVLYGAAGEDWAPGEAPGATTTSWRAPQTADPHRADAVLANAARIEAASAAAAARSTATLHKAAGKARHAHVLVLAKVAKALGVSLTRIDDAGFDHVGHVDHVDRIEPLRVASLAPPPQASAGSVEVERLLDNLATVLAEGSAARTDAGIAEPQASAAPTPSEAVARAAEPVRIDRAEIVVETHASKVLRNLGVILSDSGDAVGAVDAMAPSTPQPVVTTQGGKVMAMLGEIAATHAPVVEDGPTRRLRKLAERAARRAQAAEAAAIAQQDETGAPRVDVMLPLELPTFAALPAEVFMHPARLALEARPTPNAIEKGRASAPSPFGDRQVAISEGTLDRVRGGFAGDGLNISFGIERAVYINGTLATTTSLNISDLGQVTAGRGVSSIDAGTIALIQNGAGNSVATGSISAASIGTVIQNTLDGQKIQNITVINATANSLGMMRGMNLGSSLRGAVIDSLRR